MKDTQIRSMAVGATLHCLLGCSIGEVGGLVIGTALGMSNFATFVLSIALAFVKQADELTGAVRRLLAC